MEYYIVVLICRPAVYTDIFQCCDLVVREFVFFFFGGGDIFYSNRGCEILYQLVVYPSGVGNRLLYL